VREKGQDREIEFDFRIKLICEEYYIVKICTEMHYIFNNIINNYITLLFLFLFNIYIKIFINK